jgi:hypothetical protein
MVLTGTNAEEANTSGAITGNAAAARRPARRLATGQLRQASGQPEVLTAGQVGIDRRVLASKADPVADTIGVADHVMAEDLRVPAVGWEDRCQDPDRGGLAGAVGPKQPEHGAGRHLVVDAGQGDHVAEALDQALHQDGGVAHGRDAGTIL